MFITNLSISHLIPLNSYIVTSSPWLCKYPPNIWFITVVSLLNLSSLSKAKKEMKYDFYDSVFHFQNDDNHDKINLSLITLQHAKLKEKKIFRPLDKQ